MPRIAIIIFLALILLPAGSPAQTPGYHYAPQGLAQVEGAGGDDYPFGVPVIRYQQIQDGFTRRLLVDELAFRRDGLRTTPMSTWKVDLELFLASAKNPASMMATTFAANRGQDYTRVVNRGWVHFPSLPLASKLPCPFLVTIPFTTPFPYKASGSLLWEVAVHGNAQGGNKNLKVYNFLDAQTPTLVWGPHSNYGQGCKGANNKIPTLDAAIRNDGYFRGTIGDSSMLTPGVAFFGVTDSFFFTITLPFDLGPLGAPGCKLLSDQILYWPFLTNGFGSTLFQVGNMPISPPMEGLPIYGQGAILDIKANALGMVFTPGIKLVVPTNIKSSQTVSRLYSLGTTTVPQGIRNAGYGLVTRFSAK